MSGKVADIILFNANVLTLNSRCPWAELVAVQDGRILGVGGNEALGEFKGASTEAIDCRGRTVIPGFNDAHCHLAAYAESLLSANLNQDKVQAITDIQNEIRKLAGNLPVGKWVRGAGYNEFYLAEKRHPNRWDLDEATINHPVKLTHRSGHAHVLNSRALELIGISGETPEPPGGMIERNLMTGEPNGVLYGMGDYLAELVPPLDEKELEHGIKLASDKLISLGITSLQDASPRNDLKRWQKLKEWQDRGQLRTGVTMMLGIDTSRQCLEQDVTLQRGDHKLRLGAVKIILDETRGQLNPPQTELNETVLEIHQSGFQVALHAVEENTIEAACLALEYTLQRVPRTDHRHRVEHSSVCTPSMARRLASLGAVVVTQPSFIYYSGERYLATVPEEQLRHLYPIATLIKAGLKVGAGSDCPVVPPDPLSGIYAAVTRKAKTGQTILPEERITPLEALRMYTEGAAFACFEEAVKGSILPGKVADLAVLNADPLSVAPEDIEHLTVEMTMADGEIVWRRSL
ncbi:amidohydrolase [Chloroflexota bacterium]